jgi:hypothetical protein
VDTTKPTLGQLRAEEADRQSGLNGEESPASDRRGSERRKGGRPPGARDKAPRRRAGDPLRPVPTPAPEDEAPTISPEALSAMLDQSLEDLADVPVVLLKMPPPCSPDEKRIFRQATKPVLMKHLGDVLAKFGPEVICIVTLLALYGPRIRSKRERQASAGGGPPGVREDVAGEAAAGAVPAPAYA